MQNIALIECTIVYFVLRYEQIVGIATSRTLSDKNTGAVRVKQETDWLEYRTREVERCVSGVITDAVSRKVQSLAVD